MADAATRLRRAVTAFRHPRTPGRISSLLKAEGPAALDPIAEQLPLSAQGRVRDEVESLCKRDIDVMFIGDDLYPRRLAEAPGSPPLLFFRGDPTILAEEGVGMCGSRHVTELGLQAAQRCGQEAAGEGFVVMSGYARGVDMATHVAALETHGKTVIVLAEGINHFKVKKDLPKELVTPESVCVVSQFPPSQPWTAGGAMTRNAVIVGLGLALIVVEAGEKGGTLAAGEHALKVGRPVLVLDFGSATPAGNRLLLEAGGRPVSDKDELVAVLRELRRRQPQPIPAGEQLSLT